MKYTFLVLLSAALLFFGCKKESTNTASYTVVYNGNGHTAGAAPVDGQAYKEGGSAIVLDNTGGLVKSGFKFAGWNTAADGSGLDYGPGLSITVRSNVTLYARWQEARFSVDYYGNGNTIGVSPIDPASYKPGDTATVKGNIGNLKKDNMTFKGWNTEADGSGQIYLPGDKITMQDDLKLYAVYGNADAGKYIGFDYSGKVKSKSSVTAPWADEDPANTFGNQVLVTVVWNGSKYIGFDYSGKVQSKATISAPWVYEDLANTFGNQVLIAVVWNGSKYIGFDYSGKVQSKASLTAPWIYEDLTNTFGSQALVSVVWNGSKYIGFDYSGKVQSKASLTTPWVYEDLANTFGSQALVSVVWNGSKYIGFDYMGKAQSKASLTAPWAYEDLANTFGNQPMVCATYVN